MSKKDKEVSSKEEAKEKIAEQEMTEAAGEETKAKELYDRLLRVSADFENYKKRAQKDKEEFRKIANEALLEELLPVLDNFDRALQHAEKDTDPKHVLQGVVMIRKLFEDTLKKHGVTDIHSLGEKFDPNKHEAIAFEETDDKEEGIVVEVYRHGYLLHGRLLQPATVKITKRKTPAPAPSTPEKS